VLRQPTGEAGAGSDNRAVDHRQSIGNRRRAHEELMADNFGWGVERPFLVSVGEIVIRWGYIDTLLAQTCGVLFEQFGGHSSEKRPPRALGRRLAYIGKCFRNNPTLLPLAALAENIATAARQIAKHRDFLVHGCLTEYIAAVPSFQFTKLDGREDNTGYEQTSTKLTERELIEISEAAFAVLLQLSELGTELRKLAVTP